MVEKCLPEEEQREEKNYLHNAVVQSHIKCVAFSSLMRKNEVNNRMNFERLGKNSEFQKVYKFGKSKANKYLVMILVKRESGPNRYGFSVSKKVGNSVVRHRVTRLLRESVRKNDAHLMEGYNIVIVARHTAKDRTFDEINRAVCHLCKLHGIVK